MYKPKFSLVLKNENFYPDKFICLGSQLSSIIGFLIDHFPAHFWYATDIEGSGKGIKKLNLDSNFLEKIGTGETLIKICSEVDQFIWGTFFAIEKTYALEKSIKINLSTEDEPFRPLNIEGILIEIRAFDTSFFEIFSDNEEIIAKLSDRFKCSYIINK